jgi:hypothetical protein
MLLLFFIKIEESSGSLKKKSFKNGSNNKRKIFSSCLRQLVERKQEEL